MERRRLLESLAVLGIATAASPAAAALESIRSSVHNAFTAPAYREWCTVAGMLACSMAKSLSNLGHAREAGKWWRTAQSANDASENLDAQLWVRSQRVIHGLYEKRSPHLLLRESAEAIQMAHGHACHGLASLSTGPVKERTA